MTEETRIDLLTSKILNSPKEKQAKLLSFFLNNNPGTDDILVDFLNNKKLYSEATSVTEGTWITIDIDKLSTYPKIDKQYYAANNLIYDTKYVKLYAEYINPVTGYIGLKYMDSNGQEKVNLVYPNYIPDQKTFELTM
jgi:hypothetical protein